jgi:hypothetical protein
MQELVKRSDHEIPRMGDDQMKEQHIDTKNVKTASSSSSTAKKPKLNLKLKVTPASGPTEEEKALDQLSKDTSQQKLAML